MQRFTRELDGPVHGHDYGGQGQLVLLVHGLGGSAANWAGVGEGLTSHGHVVAPDLPGFGRTPPAGRSARIDAQADFLADFIQAETNEPAIIVANSMGGLISMLLAARYPHLVDRLVLLNPASPNPTPATVDKAWAAMMVIYLVPGLNRALLAAIQRRSDARSRTKESMDIISGGPGRVPAWLTDMHVEVAQEREQMPWASEAYLTAFKSIMRRLYPISRYDRIVHRIMARTLLVHGTVDGIVPYAGAKRLAEQRPDWEFVTLDDTGHVPHLEASDTVIKLVDEFLTVPV